MHGQQNVKKKKKQTDWFYRHDISVTELHTSVPLPLNSNLDVFEIRVSGKGAGDVSLGPVRQGHIPEV